MNEPIDMDATLRRLERAAVERRMVFLAEQIKRLPASGEGVWIKAQVLELIDEATTPSASGNGPDRLAAVTPLPLPAAPAAATAFNERALPGQSGEDRI